MRSEARWSGERRTASHDDCPHQPRLNADRIIVDCLTKLRYPIRGCTSYLVGLLRSDDERLATDALEYLRRWDLAAAAPSLRALLADAHLAPSVRRATQQALAALDQIRRSEG